MVVLLSFNLLKYEVKIFLLYQVDLVRPEQQYEILIKLWLNIGFLAHGMRKGGKGW